MSDKHVSLEGQMRRNPQVMVFPTTNEQRALLMIGAAVDRLAERIAALEAMAPTRILTARPPEVGQGNLRGQDSVDRKQE